MGFYTMGGRGEGGGSSEKIMSFIEVKGEAGGEEEGGVGQTGMGVLSF